MSTPAVAPSVRRQSLLVVDIDACNVDVGSVLHQVEERVVRVHGYYSKLLNSAQRNLLHNQE